MQHGGVREWRCTQGGVGRCTGPGTHRLPHQLSAIDKRRKLIKAAKVENLGVGRGGIRVAGGSRNRTRTPLSSLLRLCARPACKWPGITTCAQDGAGSPAPRHRLAAIPCLSEGLLSPGGFPGPESGLLRAYPSPVLYLATLPGVYPIFYPFCATRSGPPG